jgi:signal transduction histidine kinase
VDARVDQSPRRETWLAASNAVTAALLAGEDRQLTMHHIATHARTAAGASAAAIAHPAGDAPSTLIFDVVDAETDTAPLVGLTIPFAGTATGQAFVSGRSVTIRNYGDHVMAQQADAGVVVPAVVKDLDSAVVAPLIAGGRRLGALIVARFNGMAPFAADEVALVENFARHAALVTELARGDEDSHRLAVLEDRHRIARDLHDIVIQRLYAVGLRLYALADKLPEPTHAHRAQELVDELDTAIQNIRASIFALEEPGTAQGNARSQLWHLVHGFADILGFEPWVEFDGPIDAALSDRVRLDLHAAVRESLSNVAKHAAASSVYVGVAVDEHGSELTLTVVDNGLGIGAPSARRGGLANLQARAAQWAGSMSVDAETGRGTRIRWTITLPDDPGSDST